MPGVEPAGPAAVERSVGERFPAVNRGKGLVLESVKIESEYLEISFDGRVDTPAELRAVLDTSADALANLPGA